MKRIVIICMVACISVFSLAGCITNKNIISPTNTTNKFKLSAEGLVQSLDEPILSDNPTETPTSTPIEVVTTILNTTEVVTPSITPTSTPTPQPTKAPMPVYESLNIDPTKTIKNSDRFIVNLSSLTPKLNDRIIFTVKNLDYQKAEIIHTEVYENSMLSGFSGSWENDGNGVSFYKSEIIANSSVELLEGNTIKVYIFLIMNSEEGVYEYQFTLNVQP